jgi:hypothetical protein
LLLCLGTSKFDDAPERGLATPAGLPGLPTPGPSRGTRSDGFDLRLWASSPERPEEQRHDFAVESLRNLEETVLPFFEQHPLVVKQSDFVSFAAIVRAMRRKEHLTRSGFEQLVRLAYGMNVNGKQRTRKIEQVLAGSSETAREAPRSTPLQFPLKEAE